MTREGSGSLLINIGKSLSKFMENKNRIKYYAQELKQNTYNLTRMNLVMRDILPDNIVTRNADTLEDDWPFFEDNNKDTTYNLLPVDAVVSNPPYSQSWTGGKETDPRYAGYGLAPKSKADYAFLLHDLYHVKNDGIMTIVLPHGVLFRGGEEGEIRKKLIEKDKIDAIIGLPANIFFGTGIPTIIIILKQKRDNSDILIVDASKGFIKDGKNNKLRACDIKKIVDVITKRENVEKFSRVVNKEEIRKNDYNLNIPRYVNSSEKAETWDIYSSMFGGIPIYEVNELKDYWKVLPDLKSALFEQTSSDYCKLTSDNVKETIKQHSNILSFESKYTEVFNGIDDYFYNKLIDNMNTLNIFQTEQILADDIFARLSNIPLIDKYVAYQLLDDEWNKIAVDLEMIQTEGFDTIKKVGPNMVIKKKNGKEQEVQEGWIGHILPFELVQNILISNDKNILKEKENRLLEISSEYEELFNSLTEEEKDASFVNDARDKFVTSEVKKVLKSDIFEVETMQKLRTANDIISEEKELKSQIKKLSEELESKTKETIENLTDEKARELLKEKWITPIVEGLIKLPNNIINNLVCKIDYLAKKYETTFEQLEEEIEQIEKELCSMIDELCGNEFDMLGLKEFKKLLGGE